MSEEQSYFYVQAGNKLLSLPNKKHAFPSFRAEKLQYSLLAAAAETTHITASAKWKRAMTHPTYAPPDMLSH